MRSGDPFSVEITFDEGFPDAAISWKLVDGDNTQIATGNVTPAAGDVSSVILVSGAYNTLSGGALFGNRELSWSYAVGGLTKADQRRYDVEAFLPYGVSRDGVRTKLGLQKDEAPDDEIDLVTAYMEFQSVVTAAVLSAVTDSYAKLLVRHAVEALAGLKLIPSLQVRLAQKEVSGVSQYQRAKIDWAEVAAYLNGLIANGYTALNPDLDPGLTGSIFLTVVRSPDAVTGV